MLQLLRALSIIIILIPSFMCFAQESTNKHPSSSSAQKMQEEKQKRDSPQSNNTPAVVPALLGAIRPLELSPEANAWAVQIISRGGLTGSGSGDLTITSQGKLVWNAAGNLCDAKLRDDVLQRLTQTAFSADASNWGGPTASVCKDCYVTAIVLQRRERDGAERVYITSWDDATQGSIIDEVKKVYETFMAHKGCKQ